MRQENPGCDQMPAVRPSSSLWALLNTHFLTWAMKITLPVSQREAERTVWDEVWPEVCGSQVRNPCSGEGRGLRPWTSGSGTDSSTQGNPCASNSNSWWVLVAAEIFLSFVIYIMRVPSHSVESDSATPWAVACQAPLPMGILQARILEWVAMFSFKGSSHPRDWTQVSRIAGGFSTIWPTREVHLYNRNTIVFYWKESDFFFFFRTAHDSITWTQFDPFEVCF